MADTRSLLAEARELFQRGRLEEAAALVRRVASASPRDPTVVNFEAYLAWKRGRAEEAVASYRRLLELEPGNAAHAANLGLVCFKTGRFDEALAAWARQLELQPGDPRALRGAGGCHERVGDLERALDCYQRAGDEKGADRIRAALLASQPPSPPRAARAGARAGQPAAARPAARAPEGREAPRVEDWVAAAAAEQAPAAAPAQAVVRVRGKVYVNPAYLSAHAGVLVFGPTTREAGKAAGRFGDPRVALVRAEGNGELVLAAGGRSLLPLRLGGGRLCVNAPALASCDDGVELRFEPSGMRKGLFQAVELSGSGAILLAFQGGPLVVPVPGDQPALVRPHAAVAWTGDLIWEPETVADLRKHAGKDEALRYRFEGRGHLILQAV